MDAPIDDPGPNSPAKRSSSSTNATRSGPDMREWCSCGAAIRARRLDVIEWRQQHHCPDRPTQGDQHVGTGAQVERSYQDEDNTVRIGFHP